MIALSKLLGMLWPSDWIIFVVLCPVGWLAWELIGEAMGREPLGTWVDKRNAHQRFFLLRVGYLLIRTAVVFAILAVVLLLLRFR